MSRRPYRGQYELRWVRYGDGSACLAVAYRPLGAWVVGEGADVRFRLDESYRSPANRRALAHLRRLVGVTSLPNWRVAGAFEEARIREVVRTEDAA
jgi:hypothetical protein